jgi:amidophosphoribosyltransferase
MCGIVGIVGNSAVNQRIYDALTVLQHRGQDAAGIATSVEGELYTRKGSGLVRDVFQQHHMLELRGNYGIGHVRYPTAGCDSASEAQPFYVNAPYGICLAHNGNLTNAQELAEVITREDRRHLNTTSDSEVLLNVFASELQRIGTPRVTPADVFAALNAVYRRCRGGYAVVAMIIGHGARPAGHSARHGMDACIRKRRARHADLPLRARHRSGRGGVHRRAGPTVFPAAGADGAAHAVYL